MKNRHIPNRIIWLAEHLPQNMLHILVVFYLVWNVLENVYTKVVLDLIYTVSG